MQLSDFLDFIRSLFAKPQGLSPSVLVPPTAQQTPTAQPSVQPKAPTPEASAPETPVAAVVSIPVVHEPQLAQAPMTTPAGFVAAIGPAARTSMAKTRIPASFTVAEAALESGWGAHCPGRNLFGIKADLSWTGATTMQMTHEVIDGQTETIIAKFRAYPDWLGSIEDHARFLLDNPRYRPAFATTDGGKFATAVARAGYATDPQYAAKICAIIEAHHLAALDTEVV
jgi:flagellum-specific peptidoglycan hydrolase FlgJ